MEYIYWKIIKGKKYPVDMVEFYLEKNGKTKIVHTEELENVIGDYVDQREDEWTEE